MKVRLAINKKVGSALVKRKPVKPEDRKLAQNIRLLRIARGMTQEELGIRLGLNTSYIAYVETFRRGVSLTTLYKLAKIFNVKVKDLFTF